MRLSKGILFFLIAVFASQCVFYYPNLPAEIASHFGASGEPDGWMSKESYFAVLAVVLGLIVLEFTFLPFLVEKMPVSLVNMPNKEYWFSGETRGETIEIFRHFFEWFSAALLGLFIGINQLVIRANLTGESLSSNSWLILGAFLLFVVVWLIKFVRRFRIENI